MNRKFLTGLLIFLIICAAAAGVIVARQAVLLSQPQQNTYNSDTVVDITPQDETAAQGDSSEAKGTIDEETAAILGITPEMDDEEIRNAFVSALGQCWNQVTIYPTMEVTEGEKTAVVGVSNGKDSLCSIFIRIVIPDPEGEGQVIAQTGLIDPGYCLTQVKLSQPLQQGIVKAVAQVTFVLPKGVQIGTMGQMMTIYCNKAAQNPQEVQ